MKKPKINFDMLGVVSLGLTILTSVISSRIDDKKRQEEIDEAVEKRFAQLQLSTKEQEPET